MCHVTLWDVVGSVIYIVIPDLFDTRALAVCLDIFQLRCRVHESPVISEQTCPDAIGSTAGTVPGLHGNLSS